MKKIKYFWTCLLLIFFVAITGGVLMLACHFTSSCSQQPIEEKIVNDPILEQKYISYRNDAQRKILTDLYENTINNKNEFPGGWRPEYTKLIEMYATKPTENLDTSKDWWYNWSYLKTPSNYDWQKNNQLYMNWEMYSCNGNWDDQSSYINSISIRDCGEYWIIGGHNCDIRLWLDSSTSQNPDPYLAKTSTKEIKIYK